MTYVDKHPLATDFPELRDRIHALKTSNAHFAKLVTEYEALEHLKMRRVQLKDEHYAMLTAP